MMSGQNIRKDFSIDDIDMGDYGQSDDCLATTGVGPCVAFVVILNHGQNVFIEHLTDISLPEIMNLENVRLCLKDVANHVFDVLPTSNIEAVLILGGTKEQERFKTLQDIINDLSRSDLGIDHGIKSGHYKQLINNIIGNIPCFNTSPHPRVDPRETGEAALDLIVDKKSNDGERLIVVIQRVNQFAKSSIIVGTLVIGLKSNNRWYSLDQAAIKETHDDTQDRWQYVNEVAAQFESCSIALGAIKVEDVMVNHLLQYGQFLSSKVKTNFDED